MNSMKEILYPPLVHWKSIINGYLAGSLITSSLFNSSDFLIQCVGFIFGIGIFLDTILPAERMMYAVQVCISAVLGGIVGLVLTLTGISIYITVVFILSAFLYIKKVIKWGYKRFLSK